MGRWIGGFQRIAAFVFGRFAVLNGFLRTFIDAAQTLITLCLPLGGGIVHGDCTRRTILGAKPAAVAGGEGVKRFGTAGKAVESKMNKAGL